MTLDLITATPESFSPFLNQDFRLMTEGGSIVLTLDNIKRFETSDVRDDHLEIDGIVYPPRQAFALTFVGPRNPVLPSMSYAISHGVLGEFELFVSAFRQDQSCMLYESVFN